MYDWTCLIQLTKRSHCRYFDLIPLDSFAELLCHVGATSDQAAAGFFPDNWRQRPRCSRKGGVEQKLHHLVSRGRLTLLVILLMNIQSHENKMNELHAQISTQWYLQDCYMLCFCETWLGGKTTEESITPKGYTVFRPDCNTGVWQNPQGKNGHLPQTVLVH